jgi:glycosyltransferase involved in cell wall biosynthesis
VKTGAMERPRKDPDKKGRPKRLMFFVTEDWYFVSHRLHLASKAVEAGYEVSVIARPSGQTSRIESAGIAVIPIRIERSGTNLLSELRLLVTLAIVLFRMRPDILHNVAIKPVIFGSLAAKVTGVPLVVNALGGLGYVFTSKVGKARLLKPMIVALLRGCLSGPRTRLILQNDDDRRTLVDDRIISNEKVTLVRGVGVDLSEYCCKSEPADRPVVVVMPARLLRDKGIREFVEAARILKSRKIEARCALVGAPDPHNPASVTQQQVDSWVQEGIVEAWGWCADMPKVFESAHIVCLPSYREGLPKALLEAMAAGKPIVTTDVPGCKDVVSEGVNGMLVPARDPEALATALGKLIVSADLRRELGTAGRHRAETEFSAEAASALTLALYASIL